MVLADNYFHQESNLNKICWSCFCVIFNSNSLIKFFENFIGPVDLKKFGIRFLMSWFDTLQATLLRLISDMGIGVFDGIWDWLIRKILIKRIWLGWVCMTYHKSHLDKNLVAYEVLETNYVVMKLCSYKI